MNNNPLDILDQIEYSRDGFVKRYPSEIQYENALRTLRDFFKARNESVEAAFTKAFEGYNYGEEETKDARAWFEAGYNSAPTTALTLEQYKPNSVNSNNCHQQAILALRYIGTHGKTPIGGSHFPNDECCLMIADELEVAWDTISRNLKLL